MAGVNGATLRRWRESQGWDVPRMARELRRAASESGEQIAAPHGLVRMIREWEQGARAPRERYKLLYLQVFADAAGGKAPGLDFGADFAARLADMRLRTAALPGSDEITALETAALAAPGQTMTPEEIRAMAAEAITHLHAAADRLAQLAALLGDEVSEVQQ